MQPHLHAPYTLGYDVWVQGKFQFHHLLIKLVRTTAHTIIHEISVLKIQKCEGTHVIAV